MRLRLHVRTCVLLGRHASFMLKSCVFDHFENQFSAPGSLRYQNKWQKNHFQSQKFDPETCETLKLVKELTFPKLSHAFYTGALSFQMTMVKNVHLFYGNFIPTLFPFSFHSFIL